MTDFFKRVQKLTTIQSLLLLYGRFLYAFLHLESCCSYDFAYCAECAFGILVISYEARVRFVVLSDHYGMGSISALHGITLSAWAVAGLTGNQLATWIVNISSSATVGYQNVLYVVGAFFVVALVLSMVFVRPKKEEN